MCYGCNSLDPPLIRGGPYARRGLYEGDTVSGFHFALQIGWSVTSQNRLKSLKTLTGQTRSDFSLPNQLKKVF